MKKATLLITLLLSINAQAFPGVEDKNFIKDILEKCSSADVKVLSYLYIGEGLNKDCLVSEYNKVFKQDSHKKLFAYTDWSRNPNGKSESKIVYPEYQTEIKNYPDAENIKIITSIWSFNCGETCRPAKDFLYEAKGKFWFAVPNEPADMKILKMDAESIPLLIQVIEYYSTGSRNNILHIPKGKIFNIGSGGVDISALSLEEVVLKKSWSKGYFNQGGAFWYDSVLTLNFDTEKSTWKYINSSSCNCMKKEDFLEASGLEKAAFDDISDEICWEDYREQC